MLRSKCRINVYVYIETLQEFQNNLLKFRSNEFQARDFITKKVDDAVAKGLFRVRKCCVSAFGVHTFTPHYSI